MATIDGTAGNDVLTGTNDADVINGLDGNDSINGLLGADQLSGGRGDDVFVFSVQQGGTAAAAAIDGGEGIDEINLRQLLSGFTLNTISPDRYRLTVGSLSYDVASIERILFGDKAQVSLDNQPDKVNVFDNNTSLELRLGLGNDEFSGNGLFRVFGEAGQDVFNISVGAVGASGELDGGDGRDILNITSDFSVDLGAGTIRSGNSQYIIRNIEVISVDVSKSRADNIVGDDADNSFSGFFSNVNLFGVTFDGRGGDDQLIGSYGRDVLIGGTGNDNLVGVSGDDILIGGPGADRLSGGGGRGVDFASYADSTEGLTVSLADPTQRTGIATGDTFQFISGLIGSDFADRLIGDSQNNVIQGGSGDDIIISNGGSDTLFGEAGNDRIVAGRGASELTGGGGNDIFEFQGIVDSTATTPVGPSTITDFATGADKIDVSSLSPTSVTIAQENGQYTLRAVATDGTLIIYSANAIASSDVINPNKGLTLTGTADYDFLVGSGRPDRLTGGGSGDVLTGGAGADAFAYLAPSDSTGASYDIIRAFERGVDKIDLSAVQPSYISILHTPGASFLFPATSSGTMVIAVAGDVQAPDLITGGVTNLYLVGDDTASDTLIGGLGSDTIVGGGGNDIIIGGEGGDALFGNAGADTFRFTAASQSTPKAFDIIQDFTSGTDIIDIRALGLSGNIRLLSTNGGTLLFDPFATFVLGATTEIAGTDLIGLVSFDITGDAGANRLTGGALRDDIKGGAGNDILTGGGGSDYLRGGSGDDIFIYHSSKDSLPSDDDIIFDFEKGIDKIDLTALHTSPLDRIALLQDSFFSYVFVDLLGDGTNDLKIEVRSLSIAASDLLF